MVWQFLKSIFPFFLKHTRPSLPSGMTVSASQFQRSPSTKTINEPLKNLVAIKDGSYDNFQVPPIWDSCYSHSIPRTEGPPPSDYLSPITGRAHDYLFPVSISVQNLTAYLLIVELPQKIYMFKFQDKYIPLDYVIDIDRGIFDYTHFGKSMCKPASDWTNNNCTDMIIYSEEIDRAALEKS